MELLCLWNQFYSDRVLSRDTSGNQMVEFLFKRPWLGHDKSLDVRAFRRSTSVSNPLQKQIDGKSDFDTYRKLSIFHLFTLIIQILSFPLTASFAFSISGVYFLFKDRVTTVIPFVPLLPNSRNKCCLRLGFNKKYFSSFSQRIQPDFILT